MQLGLEEEITCSLLMIEFKRKQMLTKIYLTMMSWKEDGTTYTSVIRDLQIILGLSLMFTFQDQRPLKHLLLLISNISYSKIMLFSVSALKNLFMNHSTDSFMSLDSYSARMHTLEIRKNSELN